MKETDPEKAADFLEAALFGGEDLLDQATVDLSVELPLVEVRISWIRRPWT
jgi:hypothetical protein